MTYAIVTFTVARPMSVNRAYGRSAKPGAGRKGLYKRAEYVEFEERIRTAALVARSATLWPASLYAPKRVRMSYQLWNYLGDTDGPRKALRDSCERILYARDSVVEDGPAPLARKDDGGPRVEVTVELLEVHEALTAERRERDAEKRAVARITKRARMGAA